MLVSLKMLYKMYYRFLDIIIIRTFFISLFIYIYIYFLYIFQYGHVSELNSKKIRDEEQKLLELFNLESSKLRLLRTSQQQEEEERQEIQKKQEEIQSLEDTTKKMNSIIARASREDKEEEAQVIYSSVT